MGATYPKLVRPPLERTEAGYWYIPVPNGVHYRVKRIWVNKRLLDVRKEKYKAWRDAPEEEREVAEFKKDALFTWINTEKGNIVIKPYDLGFPIEDLRLLYSGCGYRGYGKIEYKEPPKARVIYQGEAYHSPRGSLGVEQCHLIVCTEGLRVSITRTGRLYGSWSQMDFIVKKVNGEWKLLEMVEDDLEKHLE